MKKLFAMLAATSMLIAMPMVATADDSDMYEGDGSLCEYCWEKGSFTEENPTASQIALFPVRVTTGAIGAPIGALAGLGTGTVDAVSGVSNATFGNIVSTEGNGYTNTVETIAKAPFLIPAGVVGTVLAVPVGMTYGAITGTFKGFAKGYMYPDTF